MSLRAWRRWGHGVIGAAINSAAGGVALVIVDPQDFNLFGGGAVQLGKVMVALALVGAALYIKEHQVPLDDEPAP